MREPPSDGYRSVPHGDRAALFAVILGASASLEVVPEHRELDPKPVEEFVPGQRTGTRDGRMGLAPLGEGCG